MNEMSIRIYALMSDKDCKELIVKDYSQKDVAEKFMFPNMGKTVTEPATRALNFAEYYLIEKRYITSSMQNYKLDFTPVEIGYHIDGPSATLAFVALYLHAIFEKYYKKCYDKSEVDLNIALTGSLVDNSKDEIKPILHMENKIIGALDKKNNINYIFLHPDDFKKLDKTDKKRSTEKGIKIITVKFISEFIDQYIALINDYGISISPSESKSKKLFYVLSVTAAMLIISGIILPNFVSHKIFSTFHSSPFPCNKKTPIWLNLTGKDPFSVQCVENYLIEQLNNYCIRITDRENKNSFGTFSGEIEIENNDLLSIKNLCFSRADFPDNNSCEINLGSVSPEGNFNILTSLWDKIITDSSPKTVFNKKAKHLVENMDKKGVLKELKGYIDGKSI